jgi:hypothetical protein
MKRFIFFLSVFCISFNLHSCAEMAAGLSSFNQANGSQCRVKSCDSQVYDSGEYKNAVRARDSRGNDIRSKEKNWVKSQIKNYVNYNFGVYYGTSPYSGGKYRFTTYCSTY